MPDRELQLKALSNANRLEILRLLIDPATHFQAQESADPVSTGVCINLIADELEITQPTVSRHVDLLKRAGFITVKRRQQWSYCKRNEKCLSEHHKWLRRELKIK